MSQPAKAQEPSMEEILASIRRIISDDEAKPAEPVAVAPPAPVAAPRPAPAAPAKPSSKPGALATAKPAAPVMVPPVAAAPPKPAPAPPKPAPVAEKNSQDDIDAMLAAFDTPEPAAAASVAAVPVEDENEDVFELTEQMTIPAPASGFQRIEPQDDVEFSEPPVEPPKVMAEPPRPAPLELPPSSSGQATGAPVLTGATAAAVESAFNTLANTVLSNNARTLEDLVKEMLRPMLKSWMDDNLPTMVERIVRAEIERVARGR